MGGSSCRDRQRIREPIAHGQAVSRTISEPKRRSGLISTGGDLLKRSKTMRIRKRKRVVYEILRGRKTVLVTLTLRTAKQLLTRLKDEGIPVPATFGKRK